MRKIFLIYQTFQNYLKIMKRTSFIKTVRCVLAVFIELTKFPYFLFLIRCNNLFSNCNGLKITTEVDNISIFLFGHTSLITLTQSNVCYTYVDLVVTLDCHILFINQIKFIIFRSTTIIKNIANRNLTKTIAIANGNV